MLVDNIGDDLMFAQVFHDILCNHTVRRIHETKSESLQGHPAGKESKVIQEMGGRIIRPRAGLSAPSPRKVLQMAKDQRFEACHPHGDHGYVKTCTKRSLSRRSMGGQFGSLHQASVIKKEGPS